MAIAPLPSFMKVGRVEYCGENFYVQAIEDGAKMFRIDGDILGDYKKAQKTLYLGSVQSLCTVRLLRGWY